MHLSCERRGGEDTTNPYRNRQNAFHITFYEMVPTFNAQHDLEQSTIPLGGSERNESNIVATEQLVEICREKGIKGFGRLCKKPPTEEEKLQQDQTGGEHCSTYQSLHFRQSAFTAGFISFT